MKTTAVRRGRAMWLLREARGLVKKYRADYFAHEAIEARWKAAAVEDLFSEGATSKVSFDLNVCPNEFSSHRPY